jgi:hypothetical protein
MLIPKPQIWTQDVTQENQLVCCLQFNVRLGPESPLDER